MSYICTAIVRWCNGSTADFGSAGSGSNPGRITRKVRELISRGQRVPSFFTLVKMIEKKEIEKLVDEHLGNGALFPVYIKVSAENSIKIVIDGDNGVTIDDCIALSRFVEHNLDRDKEDFELSVLSAGLEHPLSLLRQYRKNLNRSVKILFNEGKEVCGKLLKADENSITIQEEIVKQYKKNKKTILGDILKIPLSEIKQTRAVVSF